MVGIPSSRPRRHAGDIMSAEKRSAVMARIKGRDTGPERAIAAALRARGLVWEGHVGDLPGRPDFVFRRAQVAVFVDGSFFHGWRFPRWRNKLPEKWQAKIESNRRRDARNHRRLRHMGWRVVRIWEHQVRADVENCMGRVMRALGAASSLPSTTWRPARGRSKGFA